jgi:ABC-type multidrug transport system fused ATPase/permease subunit
MLRSGMSEKMHAFFFAISGGSIAFAGTADFNGHELKAEVTESVAPRKVTEDAIIANLRLGNANEFITKYLKGLFHDNRGASSPLRVGKMQTIFMARAEGRNPVFLLPTRTFVTDEMTKVLDTQSASTCRSIIESLRGRAIQH